MSLTQDAAAQPTVRPSGSGYECPQCGLRSVLMEHRRCTDCGSDLIAATFAGHGVVWSWTVIHPGEAEPYGLVYVDLDGGPRTMARFDPAVWRPGCGMAAVVGEVDGLAHLHQIAAT